MTTADPAPIAIGGHEGMTVYRQRPGIIRKVAENDYNWAALQNEWQLLYILRFYNLAPLPFDYNESERWIEELDLGDSVLPDDLPGDGGERLRTMWVHWLYNLRYLRIRHGDLTPVNMINTPDAVYAIDWQEAHLFEDTPPQKSPWSDSWIMCRSITNLTGDTPRVARRWMAVLEALGAKAYDPVNPLPLSGKTFVDYGCFQGVFPALAALEGAAATGIDQGGFRTGEDSITIGRDMWTKAMPPWQPIPVTLIKGNILHGSIPCDIAMCFSTWAYLVHDYGFEPARRWLIQVILNSGVLFFEHQYEGDGPGFGTRADMFGIFEMAGADAEVIATIPVAGRNASRDVWKVQSRRID